MRLDVESTRCAGHAQCVLAAPQLLELTEEGYATPFVAEVPEHLQLAAAEAIDRCPVGAITAS